MKFGKIVIAGVSILLVVGVCIGLILGFNGKDDSQSKEADALSTASKAVAAICTPTDYKQVCVSSLNAVANNQSATPQDYIQAAINATIEAVKQAMSHAGSVFEKAGNDPYQKMAKEDCDDLLQSAVAELQASFSMVGDSRLHTMSDREAEIKNWLSAVISYQQSCMDGAIQPEMKDSLSNGMLNATQLTSNALAIVSAISGIFEAFNITLDKNPSTRQLLETENGEYPSWMSGADRKLLASNNNAGLKPNVVVAKDGSGQFKTIGQALASYPNNFQGRYVIYVKAGIYDEYITVDKKQVNIFMYGDGSRRTLVTGKKSFQFDKITTYRTATFSVEGNGFIAKSMGFQNTAGPEGHQAVALRVKADLSAFYNCRIDGYQDSLYVQAHRQFYRNCVISGTVDFIFGDSSTVIQNSLIILRMPMKGQKNTVTAHGRADKRESTGLVIQNCRIVPEQKLAPVKQLYPSYLGRPWKQYSKTVIMESTIGDVIVPAGWLEWDGNFALDTLYYAEYANRGPGSPTNMRVKWKGYHVITNKNEALQFTAGPFIQGNMWLQATGAPYFLGLKH